ncbi:hypothetical protein E2C01_023343 [Portunus trituberculatus]|uniref:Uncharacterized protein n=1 Tax=Portunus trituberculatus TaxID=210409 RepID=A0A5B7E8K4_PORTR|nr:hypothetical protein [Portunus trituberculatus]
MDSRKKVVLFVKSGEELFIHRRTDSSSSATFSPFKSRINKTQVPGWCPREESLGVFFEGGWSLQLM